MVLVPGLLQGLEGQAEVRRCKVQADAEET